MEWTLIVWMLFRSDLVTSQTVQHIASYEQCVKSGKHTLDRGEKTSYYLTGNFSCVPVNESK